MAQDESGCLVYVETMLSKASTAFEAKVLAIDWVVSLGVSKHWDKLCFSSGALQAVREIKSFGLPGSWRCGDSILNSRNLFYVNN